jgi:para-aminobenzoate synthetase component 1
VRLSGCGFDILHAAFEAWRGTSAILKGFLAYDLALELEQLGPAPSADFDFPSLHFEICEPVGVAPSGAGFQPVSSVTTNLDRVAFEASVERIVKTIRAGDIFQTNLCRCIEAEIAPGTEWDLFQRMRSINPAQYETFLRIGEGQAVLSTSPELFLKVEDRIVESRPIKGTRPRAATDEADQAVAKELTASEKDRAELAMIVDVVRNDLGRVCETGSVEVVSHAELMKLPTVHHLFSTVRGRLREDVELIDLLRAAFPAASITGAPKIEAMRVAMREEGRLRGPCMGAIGWISMDGRMEMSVAIRTAFVTGGRVRYYAGCGITSDSVPNSEFDESSAKAAAFLRALGLSQVSGR